MRFLAILTVKNEAAFLLEWLAHHRAVGFTDFLVFSNDCDDGTDAMLDRLAQLGWLTHVRNPGPWREGPQWAALKAADKHPLRQTADWIAVLDIDEFVNIHTGDGTLTALTDALPEATAITLTWRLFGNAGVIDYEDRPLRDQFRLASPSVMAWPWRSGLFKTLFRNNGSYGKLGVHRPRQPDPKRIEASRWFDGSGRELPASYRRGRIFTPLGQNNHELVQLNHYALGAMQSYLLKCARGRANREGAAFDMGYWVERNFCAETDESILRHDSRVAPILRELMADPALGALHAQAVVWRKARIEELLLSEDYRALFGRLLITPPSQPLSPHLARRMVALGLRGVRHERGRETMRDGA